MVSPESWGMKPPLFVRELSDAERRALQAGLRSREAFTLRRAQILLANAEGQRPARIASHVGCAVGTVHNTNANGYAVRHGDWVLIDVKTGGVSAVPAWYDEAQGYKPHKEAGELYNLKDDLAQKTNLYADHPDRVADLRKKLATIRGKE